MSACAQVLMPPLQHGHEAPHPALIAEWIALLECCLHEVVQLLHIRTVVKSLHYLHGALACGLTDGVKEDQYQVHMVCHPDDGVLNIEGVLHQAECIMYEPCDLTARDKKRCHRQCQPAQSWTVPCKYGALCLAFWYVAV